ncbi:hypothetical protein O181_038488 [Austropuccinia psidii MF-1]|uniref:Uncharacterized protein n=1 Tax=Austropuccinia psidii MF-1 TaxID=1389203 RepID=A0A9Q3HB22_9BASI|nr:hypothetical protein [Austropuccinia psidii MF-1]
MYGGMPPYMSPGFWLFFSHTSLCFSRIPTLHTQILMPVQDPNASHAKPCAVNPYAREASQQFQQFLRLFQAPNSSHANPYASAGFRHFTHKSLRRGSVPTILKIAYAGPGL